MELRSEARTEFGPWLERLAWNAAALAALAVMLLVLLASLEWLDHVTKAPATARLDSVHTKPCVHKKEGPTGEQSSCSTGRSSGSPAPVDSNGRAALRVPRDY